MVERRNKWPQVAAVVIVGLLLSGCAGPQTDPPVANATGSAVPTAGTDASTSTSTPAPTATPTPLAPDLTDPSSWVIDFTSVGPLAIGAEISATGPSMSAFTGSAAFDGCPSIMSFDRPGFPNIVITDRYDDGLVELIALQGGPTSSDFTATSPRTSSGIGIGATLEELKAAYPGITYQDDHFTPHYALPDGDGNWINFAVMDGLVNKIVVRPMSVIPREICG